MSFEEEALKTLTTSVKLNADNTLALLELAYIYQVLLIFKMIFREQC